MILQKTYISLSIEIHCDLHFLLDLPKVDIWQQGQSKLGGRVQVSEDGVIDGRGRNNVSDLGSISSTC